MKSLALGALLAGAGVSLHGCGGGSDATTTPAPGPPPGTTPGPTTGPTAAPEDTVQKVWDNHFSAFAAFDVPNIMIDYDDSSVIRTFQDGCFLGDNGVKRKGMKEYKGKAAIQGFFTSLFAQLNETLDNVYYIGPATVPEDGGAGGSPVVMEQQGKIANANVFLTWRTRNLENPIELATDTFSFRAVGDTVKIDLQTIVSSESKYGTCPEDGGQLPTTGTGDLYDGWKNHFDAFGARDADKIMADYTEDSIVQVYDNSASVTRANAYSEVKGLTAIKQMFVDLFAAMAKEATTPNDPATEGLEVGILEVDPATNSVFLAWKSTSHPKATDTFIFDGAKIARQNIVVTTKAARAVAEAFV